MTADLWQLLDDAPDYAEGVSDLWHWSTNYDPGKGPATLFLDLIGYTLEEFGETFYDLRDPSLGYVELSKLARALTEYADHPHDVRDYVGALMAAEASD